MIFGCFWSIHKIALKFILDSIVQKTKKHTIEVLIDRLINKPSIKDRLTESIELALKMKDWSQGFTIGSQLEF